MGNTQIILVEGMPGTGKSTVSQFIHRQLIATGQPAVWCHEESAPHPVRLFYDRKRHRSWSEYCAEAESIWRSFAVEVGSRDQVFVLDAAVLQNHGRSMLLFDCDRSSIVSLMRTIASLLSSLNPQWIYLKPKDLERNFREVVEERGARMLELWPQPQPHFPWFQRAQLEGLPGFLAFWKEFDEIADRVFDELPNSKLKLNVSNDDWDVRFREISTFLKLPVSFDTPPAQGLERYAGKYVSLPADSDSLFRLEVREGHLVASVDQPTIDVRQGPIGCFRHVRLIPDKANRFSVAAWPHVIEFTEDETGKIGGLRMSISANGWEDSEVVYVRQ